MRLRGAGFCAGFTMPGYANSAPGKGCGMGFGRGRRFGGDGGGRGRGWRNVFYATGLPGWARFGRPDARYQKADEELEKQTLQGRAEALQVELDFIKKRLSDLETRSTAQ